EFPNRGGSATVANREFEVDTSPVTCRGLRSVVDMPWGIAPVAWHRRDNAQGPRFRAERRPQNDVVSRRVVVAWWLADPEFVRRVDQPRTHTVDGSRHGR